MLLHGILNFMFHKPCYSLLVYDEMPFWGFTNMALRIRCGNKTSNKKFRELTFQRNKDYGRLSDVICETR